MSIKDLSPKHKQAVYLVLIIVAIAVIIVGILQYSKSENSKNMLEASSLYQKALISNENHNIPKTQKIASFDNVTTKYPSTSYSILASWQVADIYITPENLGSGKSISKDDYNSAIKVLVNSANNNPKDNLTNITNTRLASLYIQTNQADNAIKTLQSISDLDNNAYPLMILGQAYAQKGDKSEALKAWKKASQDPNATPEFKQIISQLINNTN
jgi:predicted negative regulator of RcsB-dependent stress response